MTEQQLRDAMEVELAWQQFWLAMVAILAVVVGFVAGAWWESANRRYQRWRRQIDKLGMGGPYFDGGGDWIAYGQPHQACQDHQCSQLPSKDNFQKHLERSSVNGTPINGSDHPPDSLAGGG